MHTVSESKVSATERYYAWVKANPERAKQIKNKWRAKKLAEDPDYFRKQSRARYWRNPERARQRAVEGRKKPGALEKRMAYNKEYAARNRDKVRQAQRKRNLAKKYGLTIEEYDALLAAQKGMCGICGTDDPKRNYDWRVDHCHGSGRVRGLLCNDCNLMLGLAKDRADVLSKAANYVEKHNG